MDEAALKEQQEQLSKLQAQLKVCRYLQAMLTT